MKLRNRRPFTTEQPESAVLMRDVRPDLIGWIANRRASLVAWNEATKKKPTEEVALMRHANRECIRLLDEITRVATDRKTA